MARTVLGVMPGAQPPEGAPAEQAGGPAPQGAPKGKLMRTMLGVAAPFQAPAADAKPPADPGAAGTAPDAGLKRTIIGQGIAPPPAASNAAAARPGRTMLGVAAPAIAPQAPTPDAPSGPKPQQPPAGASAARPRAGTMLGVAIPGIAPLAPGLAKSEPAAEPFQPANTPNFSPVPDVPAGLPGRRPRGPRPNAVPLYRHPAILAIGAGLVLAAGAVVFALLWRPTAPLEAEARLDPSGKDVLHITCPTCADGAVLRIGNASGVVAKHVADIALPTPLKVGKNQFSVDVDRGGKGRREQVGLLVQIGYRLNPDVSHLEGEHPTLSIKIDAVAGASVLIDGKPTVIGPDGRGSYDIDLTADCSGLADEARVVERAVAYSVNIVGSPVAHGTVNVRIGVVPLQLDSPFDRQVVTGGFLLAGRTARGARVSVAGKPVAVAPDGSFAQMLNTPTPGDNALALLASAEGQASRSATITVKRVAKLEDEARAFAAGAPLTLSELVADVPGHVGQTIALSGEVYEARVQNHQGVMLLDVPKGCAKAPCRVRVLTAGDQPWARGQKVSVFGTVARLFNDPVGAMTMPEVRASFVLLKGR
jgi:hypothetical protein